MSKFSSYSSVILFFLASSCIIVSEKDKCYEDIERGEKTAGFIDPCIGAGLLSSYAGNDATAQSMRDLYLTLCASTIIEQEKCQGKSNWIPTIDGRI
ncbi:MAG: hypothetical protein CVV45_18030 [Spirochaetae bacterium HGW-Spirochaetae-10]|nr:MAG: hypothetical protein CVV45_18030 [Spirochaetae bacterium HGW-Spirochaetae-10]